MSGITPTQRTLKAVRAQGRIVDVCERWIRNPKHPAGGFRKDLFGFIDLIAVDDTGIIGIQSCGQDFKAHIDKITGEECHENAVRWLRAARLECWGWRRLKKKRGGKAMMWKPRIADFHLIGDNIMWDERCKK